MHCAHILKAEELTRDQITKTWTDWAQPDADTTRQGTLGGVQLCASSVP